ELDIPMCLRPTSETAMYPIFALWIRSHADLPLKVFQIVSKFRYDTKQSRTIHHYRDNFAKAYEVTYEAEDGTRKFVHQTTYGMSERLLGAIVAIHGDDKGGILPPAVAPAAGRRVAVPE